MRRAARIGMAGRGKAGAGEALPRGGWVEVKAAGASLGQRSGQGTPAGGRIGYRSPLDRHVSFVVI